MSPGHRSTDAREAATASPQKLDAFARSHPTTMIHVALDSASVFFTHAIIFAFSFSRSGTQGNRLSSSSSDSPAQITVSIMMNWTEADLVPGIVCVCSKYPVGSLQREERAV